MTPYTPIREQLKQYREWKQQQPKEIALKAVEDMTVAANENRQEKA